MNLFVKFLAFLISVEQTNCIIWRLVSCTDLAASHQSNVVSVHSSYRHIVQSLAKLELPPLPHYLVQLEKLKRLPQICASQMSQRMKCWWNKNVRPSHW